MHTKQCIVGDQLITYIYSGDVAAHTPLLVFLHGWACQASTFAPILKLCERDHIPFIAIDLPGFGGSPTPLTTRTVRDYTACTHTLLDKLDLTHYDIVLVGHSFGGRIAIEYAATYPIKKLILIGSAGLSAKLVRYRSLLKTLASYIRPILRMFSVHLHEYLAQFFRSPDYQGSGNRKAIFLEAIRYDQSELLSHIPIPTLLLRGAQDTEAPLQDAYTMHSRIPNSQLIVYDTAGHFAFLEEPARTYSDLHTFIHT